MAINFKQIKEELETAPFTQKELTIIDKLENYIDSKIKEKFDGDKIYFEPKIIDINFNPDDPTQHQWNVYKDIKTTRKKLMSEELRNRFEKAGWKWKYDEGEDDGPNRPAISYWLLSGK